MCTCAMLCNASYRRSQDEVTNDTWAWARCRRCLQIVAGRESQVLAGTLHHFNILGTKRIESDLKTLFIHNNIEDMLGNMTIDNI